MSKPITINVDQHLHNADWTKRTPDTFEDIWQAMQREVHSPQRSGDHDNFLTRQDVLGIGREESESAPYGFCPKCGARGVARERRYGGNDTCENGCVYSSDDAIIYPMQRESSGDTVEDVTIRVPIDGRRKTTKENCGANAPGGGGFQQGNTCASGEDGGTPGSSRLSAPRGGISEVEATGLASLLKRKGGFTYQPIDDLSPTSGFALSVFNDAEAVIQNGTRSVEEMTRDVYAYLQKHRDRFQDPQVHAGGWHDVDAGKIYLDLSVVKPDRAEAVALAQQHNQEGIFDLGNFETIIVKDEADRRKTVSDRKPRLALSRPAALDDVTLEDFARTLVEGIKGGDRAKTTAREVYHASRRTDRNPSDAQKQAGNYKKGKLKWNGLTISIENPKGSTRSGVDPDGKPWEVQMSSHYGYFNRTLASDRDQIDVFIGPRPESEIVFVVDQVDKSGKFDEHKVLIGFLNEKQAKEGYLCNYDDGWKCGPITAMTVGQFKDWLNGGSTTKPVKNRKKSMKASILTSGKKPPTGGNSDCGANAPGGGGFQPGNTCATGDGSGGVSSGSGGGGSESPSGSPATPQDDAGAAAQDQGTNSQDAGAHPGQDATQSDAVQSAGQQSQLGQEADPIMGAAKFIMSEPVTDAPDGTPFMPDVEADLDGDGITDSARVGVPAHDVPPPPPMIPRLPNLTADERQVESEFAEAYEKNPDGMADRFRQHMIEHAAAKAAASGGKEPPTFGTDDAKLLSDVWAGQNLTPEQRASNRARYNTSLHQTANAIAKRAFMQHLDTLQPGDNILVTVGGCAAGKGYCLKNTNIGMQAKQNADAVWDSAGDQNATENAWIQREAEKRGLSVTYAYVHANPEVSWAHEKFGAVERAHNPQDGRMIDARVFADSYALGAKNHMQFYENNKTNPNAKFIWIQGGGKPTELQGMPPEALAVDRHELYRFAVQKLQERQSVAPHVKRGAMIGARIWKDEPAPKAKPAAQGQLFEMEDVEKGTP